MAQEIMEDLFRDLAEINVCINDAGAFSFLWEIHLQSVDKVLCLLQSKNFAANPLKCECGVQETNWLGYWQMMHGLKPWQKKVDSTLNLERPQTAF